MILSQALAAAIAGQEKAQSMDVLSGIAIVDANGNTLAVLRHEKAGFLTPQTSQAKAVAAAAFKKTGRELLELAKSNHNFWSAVPTVIDRPILPTAGSAPVIVDGVIVGAVGVGGGAPDQDQEIAQFVANHIQAQQ
jgi:uncharacterized protein GlcG (DUF336 family)